MTRNKLGHQNAAGGEFVEYLGHVNERVALVKINEHLLVGSFALVIKFFAQTILDLGNHVFGVQGLETKGQHGTE